VLKRSNNKHSPIDGRLSSLALRDFVRKMLLR
jgi:hypothetical protein